MEAALGRLSTQEAKHPTAIEEIEHPRADDCSGPQRAIKQKDGKDNSGERPLANYTKEGLANATKHRMHSKCVPAPSWTTPKPM